MDDKEQIDTIVSVGAGLPPLNPYLDDYGTDDDSANVFVNTTKNKKSKKGSSKKEATKGLPNKDSQPKPLKESIAPDPTEYIAELERPEEESILY